MLRVMIHAPRWRGSGGLQHFEAGGVAVDLVADAVGNGVAIGLVEVAQVIEAGVASSV